MEEMRLNKMLRDIAVAGMYVPYLVYHFIQECVSPIFRADTAADSDGDVDDEIVDELGFDFN